MSEMHIRAAPRRLRLTLASFLVLLMLLPQASAQGGAQPVSVDSQVRVSFTGFVFNRSTNTFDTIAKLTNTGSTPIAAPIWLVITSIPVPGVQLANATDKTSAGLPYVSVLSIGDLDPGATITPIVLKFSNPSRVTFTITQSVFGVVTPPNHAPVANAGPDQTVAIAENVHLDGTQSTDVDGNPLTYRWSFTSVPGGSTAQLANANTVNPTFVADKAGSYSVQLIVNDGQTDSAPATVIISTSDSALVTICHKPGTDAETTLALPSAAAKANLLQGDGLGPCPISTEEVEQVTPQQGPSGASVTITGHGFTSASNVRFGDSLAPLVIFVSETKLIAVVPLDSTGQPLDPQTVLLTVDGSAGSPFEVLALDSNPNPPGVVLDTVVQSLTQLITENRVTVENLLAQKANDPDTAIASFWNQMRSLVLPTERLVLAGTTNLPNALNAEQLAVLERLLLPAFDAINESAAAFPANNHGFASSKALISASLDGDQWLDARRSVVDALNIIDVALKAIGAVCAVTSPEGDLCKALTAGLLSELSLFDPTLAQLGVIQRLELSADGGVIDSRTSDEMHITLRIDNSAADISAVIFTRTEVPFLKTAKEVADELIKASQLVGAILRGAPIPAELRDAAMEWLRDSGPALDQLIKLIPELDATTGPEVSRSISFSRLWAPQGRDDCGSLGLITLESADVKGHYVRSSTSFGSGLCDFSVSGTWAAITFEDDTYTVAFNVSPAVEVSFEVVGQGSIQKLTSPSMRCPGNCAAWDAGATVAFLAVPAAGWHLATWGDACSAFGNAAQCTITLPNEESELAVTATFANRYESQIAVSGSPNPSTLGASVTLSAQVSPATNQQVPSGVVPSGLVTFKENNNTLCSGSLGASGLTSCNYSFSSVGAHTIVADYEGDNSFAPASNSFQQQVQGSGLPPLRTYTEDDCGQSTDVHGNPTATCVQYAFLGIPNDQIADLNALAQQLKDFTATFTITNGRTDSCDPRSDYVDSVPGTDDSVLNGFSSWGVILANSADGRTRYKGTDPNDPTVIIDCMAHSWVYIDDFTLTSKSTGLSFQYSVPHAAAKTP